MLSVGNAPGDAAKWGSQQAGKAQTPLYCSYDSGCRFVQASERTQDFAWMHCPTVPTFSDRRAKRTNANARKESILANKAAAKLTESDPLTGGSPSS